jgi:hypothetical protein
VWITEVYNTSLSIEPRHSEIEDYFAAMSELQRAGGGHPEIGPRLPSLAAGAGLAVASFRFVPVLGDPRDLERRTAIIRYFEALMRSAEPQLRAARAFDEARLPSVWAAFDAAVAEPSTVFCYTFAQLCGVVV